MGLQSVIYALVGGVLPSLLWLWFWLREDRKNPEPGYALARAFIAGVFAVPVAIYLEKLSAPVISDYISPATVTVATIATWAFIEEFLKYIFTFFSSLMMPEYDEPIDAVVYMITVALGFAAAENTAYLLGVASGAHPITDSIFTGNLRFVGATLLHILASSILGVALAFTYNKSRQVKFIVVSVALFGAAFAHFIFNYTISVLDFGLMQTFAFVWLALVALLLIFEKVKKI